jgi:hypothetical protein
MKNLVIVESPAKAKTIEKYLGKDFHVLSSVGHIRSIVKKTKDGTPPIDVASFPDLVGRVSAFLSLRKLAIPVAMAFAKLDVAIETRNSSGTISSSCSLWRIFAITILSVMASKAAPTSLVCTVRRDTGPSIISSNLPRAAFDKPQGLLSSSAPRHANIPPVSVMALGMVNTSLAILLARLLDSRLVSITCILTSICQNSNIIVTSSCSPREV